MTRLTPYRGLLANLRGEIPEANRRVYLPPDQASALLREWSGQDFGMDIEKWEAWVRDNVDESDADLE